VHYLPGFRSKTKIPPLQKENQNGLRLIFLGHIAREKGPLVLLDAMQLLSKKNNIHVTCDFYGPIHDEIRQEFQSKLNVTKNSHYRGVADAGIGSQLISAYDVLVLPSYFACEGHPGVIIEAMHAGVPVISTQHRAIPELVKDGENGFLVPVQDSIALSGAINNLALNSSLRLKMGEANYHQGKEFDTDLVVNKMLKIIFQE
jgi:glycosyltransferase involved in cell wall biosynthesis